MLRLSRCTSPVRVPASKVNKGDQPQITLTSGQSVTPDEEAILQCETIYREVAERIPARPDPMRTPTIDTVFDACAAGIAKGEQIRVGEEERSVNRSDDFLWKLLPDSKTKPMGETMLPPLRGPFLEMPPPVETNQAGADTDVSPTTLPCNSFRKCQASALSIASASCIVGAELEYAIHELESWFRSEVGQQSLSSAASRIRRAQTCRADQSYSKTFQAGNAAVVFSGGYVAEAAHIGTSRRETGNCHDALGLVLCDCVPDECERVCSVTIPEQFSALLNADLMQQQQLSKNCPDPWPFGRLQGAVINHAGIEKAAEADVRADTLASQTNV